MAPGNEYAADQLKTQGNASFKAGDYTQAESLYTQAILKNPANPLLFTNRANARLKLSAWEGVIDDCIRSIELHKENMKAYFYLAQAQLAINHPNEALSSALMAYELCSRSAQQTSNAATISALVLKAKKAKWEIRERERIRRRGDLLADLEAHLEVSYKKEQDEIQARVEAGEIGHVQGQEDSEACREEWDKKRNDLRTAFALSAPEMLQKREVPDYLIDGITFEIMVDPVITKNGRSYDRATIIEHLKRSPTDPLTREPLSIADLRPNIALKEACTEFLEGNSGWVYDCEPGEGDADARWAHLSSL